MRLDLALFALAAPLAVLGDIRHSHRRTHAHHTFAKRANTSTELEERDGSTFQSRWTFYDVGGAAGACGQFNTPDQHIVALNSAQYGGGYPGPQCWKTIVMKLGDKQTTATITDECPGCPYGGLDLTRGLFGFFADLSVGVLEGEWWFADDAPSDPSPSPSPTPKPSPKPTPTTTWKPDPPTTTTHHQDPTTSSTESSTSSTHSSTHSSSQSSSAASSSASSSISSSGGSSSGSSGLASPTGAASLNSNDPQNILACNQLLVNMGGLAVAAGQA